MAQATTADRVQHAGDEARRFALGLLAAATSALLLVAAFPPYGAWPLVWVAFVPMLLAQFRWLPPRWSSLASAVAIGGWVWAFFGPVFAGTGTVMRYLPVGAFALAFLMDRGLRSWHARSGYRWFVLQGAVGWVGIEMVRALIPNFGTWGFLAYTLHAQVWWIQPVALFGVFGLGLLIVAVNYAVAQAALAALARRRPGRVEAAPSSAVARRGLAAVGAVLVAWTAASLAMLADPAPDVRVAAVQPAVSSLLEANRGRDGVVARVLARMVEQSREAAARGARLVVWPEGALTFDPRVDDRLGLADLARETGAYLVVGYVVELAEGGFRNEATVIAPDDGFLGVFGKDHPVLFGGETSPTRGTYPVYDTSIGRLATMICFDLDFTDTARRLVRGGAEIVAVPSQDWPAIARLHFTHLVFRAVEHRVPMVKADGGFDSVILDPFGRVLARSVDPAGAEATLVADVPLRGATSWTTRLGDAFGWASLAGLAVFTLLPGLARGPRDAAATPRRRRAG